MTKDNKRFEKILRKKYGINPDIRSRNWSDSEHEILGLLIQNMEETLRNKISIMVDKCDKNTEHISENFDKLREHDKWISNKTVVQEYQNEEDKVSLKRLDSYSQLMLVLISILSLVLGLVFGGVA